MKFEIKEVALILTALWKYAELPLISEDARNRAKKITQRFEREFEKL